MHLTKERSWYLNILFIKYSQHNVRSIYKSINLHKYPISSYDHIHIYDITNFANNSLLIWDIFKLYLINQLKVSCNNIFLLLKFNSQSRYISLTENNNLISL